MSQQHVVVWNGTRHGALSGTRYLMATEEPVPLPAAVASADPDHGLPTRICDVIETLLGPSRADEIVAFIDDVPPYRVRESLRWLIQVGRVVECGRQYADGQTFGRRWRRVYDVVRRES